MRLFKIYELKTIFLYFSERMAQAKINRKAEKKMKEKEEIPQNVPCRSVIFQPNWSEVYSWINNLLKKSML